MAGGEGLQLRQRALGANRRLRRHIAPAPRHGGEWRPFVVKLGGSLAGSGRLPAILRLIATAAAPLVLVPGGGSFADTVRAAQRELGFDDPAAHRMALLAMQQMALAMASLEPRLRPAAGLFALHLAAERGTIPLWCPYRLASADPALPQNWSLTSDGLAAWLAERLSARGVILVKSCRIETCWSLARLAAAGIVDPVFAEIVARAALPWRVFGPGEEDALSKLLMTAELS